MIHHSTISKAKKLGVILEDLGDDEDALCRFKAHWPKFNTVLFAASAPDVLNDMVAAIDIKNNWASFKVSVEADDSFTITIRKTDISTKAPRLADAFKAAKEAYAEHRASLSSDDEDEDAENQAEIEAEAAAEDEEERVGGTVVPVEYRALYAERGAPDHCNDWLANLLNKYCKNDAGFNLELFAQICAANGVDLSKYKNEKPSDRGRMRMTGRNILSRIVFHNQQLNMPDFLNGGEPHAAPGDWLAVQKYQKAQPKATATPVKEG